MRGRVASLVCVLVLVLIAQSCAERARPLGMKILPDVRATANDRRLARAQNSPDLAADPTDDRFVALANRWDAPEYNCALQVSSDGGRTWQVLNPVATLPEGVEQCYAPEVAFDGTGTLFYLFAGLSGPGSLPVGSFLTSSDDQGETFTPAHQVLGPYNFGVRMAMDTAPEGPGRLHLVWLEAGEQPPLGGMPAPPNPVYAAYSDDGGKSFSPSVQVSDRARAQVVAPTLAIGEGGAVHILYYDLGQDDRDYRGLEGPTWDGFWSLVLATSQDGGHTFAEGSVVDDDVVPPERVQLVFTMPPAALTADGEGRVHAAWTDDRNGDWDVLFRTSADGGATWEEPLRLNDDPVGNGRHQYLPGLSTAASGRVDAIFFNRRSDPQNRMHHVTYANSYDGGESFSPNIAVTSERSDSQIGQTYLVPSSAGKVDLGSRLALISGDDAALVAWPDARDARSRYWQDVWVTEVELDLD